MEYAGIYIIFHKRITKPNFAGLKYEILTSEKRSGKNLSSKTVLNAFL